MPSFCLPALAAGTAVPRASVPGPTGCGLWGRAPFAVRAWVKQDNLELVTRRWVRARWGCCAVMQGLHKPLRQPGSFHSRKYDLAAPCIGWAPGLSAKAQPSVAGSRRCSRSQRGREERKINSAPRADCYVPQAAEPHVPADCVRTRAGTRRRTVSAAKKNLIA